MGILNNFETFIEKTEETENCHYCENKSEYSDIAKTDKKKYKIVYVCKLHSFKGLSS